MKLKELKSTVNVCWSPAEHYPVTIAAGSAAQQVDASFSSSSHLELYTLNLDEPGLDLALKSSLQTQHKFQKLVWSAAGVIVGGCDGGLLEFYSADKLLNNASDALLGSSTKHNGHVSSLDINPYQKNLLASGASDSEIFIWDLNNTSQPMAPGNRSQPYEHVQGLAWNQQVQHILGSTFASRCVVWDLRKNEPIMKLSDSQSRTRWRSLAWHPAVATQLCIASEDDQVPVVQLWDLRLASSPLVTLEGHHKGVMSVSWCRQDPDLLLSAGKDGRVLCWNPNNTKPGGELLAEIDEQAQWVFEVSWCGRDPSLFVTASFDQQLAVHSLLAPQHAPVNSASQQSNIMDSFGGADSFSALPAVSRAAPPAAAHTQQLPRAPLWLKRPARAKFAVCTALVQCSPRPARRRPPPLTRSSCRARRCGSRDPHGLSSRYVLHSFSALPAVSRAAPPAAAHTQQLPRAPLWLKRPARANALPAVSRAAPPAAAHTQQLPRAPLWLKRPARANALPAVSRAAPPAAAHTQQLPRAPLWLKRPARANALPAVSRAAPPAAAHTQQLPRAPLWLKRPARANALPAVSRAAPPAAAHTQQLPRAPLWLKRPARANALPAVSRAAPPAAAHTQQLPRAPLWLKRPARAKFAVCTALVQCSPRPARRRCGSRDPHGLSSRYVLHSFSALPAVSRAAPPAAAHTQQLPRAPLWLKRPARAKFAFGGKLVTFEKLPADAGPQKIVHISQVVSEPEIVERATELDNVLGSSLSQEPGATDRLAEYCRQKGDATTDQNERYTWFFLRANFLPTFRSEVLNLLGFKQDEILSKFKSATTPSGDTTQTDQHAGLSRGESTETEAELSTDTSTDLSDAHTLIERKLANIELGPSLGSNVVIPTGDDTTSLICRALVCGNLEEAVELCLDAKRIPDALIIASLGSQELLYKVQKYHLNSSSQDPVALISGSLLASRWDLLVTSAAPRSWRDTLAAIVTHCEGEALAHYCAAPRSWRDTLAAIVTHCEGEALAHYCAGGTRSPPSSRTARGRRSRTTVVCTYIHIYIHIYWDLLVTSAAPRSWRDTLAAIVTHCEGEALAHYCEMLGDKLSSETDPALSEAATICYLCAMSPEALVSRWARARRPDVSALAALTELALLARRAAITRGRQVPEGGKLESVLSEYASRLAAQGCLAAALGALEPVPRAALRPRLQHALGLVPQEARRPSHAQTPQSRVTHHNRRHVAHAEPTYGTVPAYEQTWQQASVPAPQPTYNRVGFPQPAQPAAPLQPTQPLQPMQPAPLQPAQPPQPPRPGSVGPQPGGIASRSKYKVDPSVQSAPLYNQYSFNNPAGAQPYTGYNSPLPEQYNTSVPAFNPNQNQFNPPGQVNQGQMNPGQMNQGIGSVNGNYYTPVQTATEAVPQPVQAKPVAPGWNDPPMLSSKPKKTYKIIETKERLLRYIDTEPHNIHNIVYIIIFIYVYYVKQIQHVGATDMSALHAGTRQWSHIIEHRRHLDEPKQEVTAQAPITHPLFGVEPPQHVPLAPTSQYPGQYPAQQQYQQYPGQAQQYPGQFQEQYAAPAYPQQAESPAPPPEPVPVQKAAIPEQHVILQSVFDSIRNECANRASNPQMKRKLEDVQRRLETLYDMLREYRLSDNACQSLHSCCQYAQGGNHGAALQVATALATGPDFAAVASFLPGLKMLFQLAAQLQVYAR
ncbi:COPII coat complex component secretory 31 [Anticarsia gemmatalis]|uniref:COPII coat complex component secretory 31 n=1 Tax=Anticarsia gemmatalis TaxID=129554 RepID=UPI003F768047